MFMNKSIFVNSGLKMETHQKYMPCFSPTLVIPVCLSKLTGSSWLFNKNGASCALKVH